MQASGTLEKAKLTELTCSSNPTMGITVHEEQKAGHI